MFEDEYLEARVLIVDDEPANVRLLERILQREGFSHIESTNDPRQFLALYAARRPDILLLDLHMPGMDGFAVMEQLKGRIPPHEFIPILVLTADITPQARQRALSAGAKDFLTKPVDPTEVVLRIRNLLEARLAQIRANLERLRWLPRDFGAKHVLVNAASFETRVVENGATIWTSKVIVGTPENQTVFFSDQMETVVFNPYWGVPKSIILNEMLPEIYKDPYYMEREGYEVTDLNGNVIPSYSVDWYNLNTSNLPIGVRQPPGPNNALGEIKFLFPNKHAIYMHDTPTKPLFEKPVRAYSHGCVRVQNPREFAEIILGWDQQRIASMLASTRNQSVPVEDEIRVHVTYFTAWPDETGTIRYHDDVYGRDRLLEQAMGTLTVAMR